MLESISHHWVYWLAIALSTLGLYIILAYGNLIKKLIGLNMFQSGIFILFIALGNIHNALPPLLSTTSTFYANPLPQVLILTAIVVSVSVTALGLILILRIHDCWGLLEEEKLGLLRSLCWNFLSLSLLLSPCCLRLYVSYCVDIFIGFGS